MSAYRIVYDRLRECYSVYLTGEFARYVASFPSLLEAEAYVCRGGRPDEVEPT